MDECEETTSTLSWAVLTDSGVMREKRCGRLRAEFTLLYKGYMYVVCIKKELELRTFDLDTVDVELKNI